METSYERLKNSPVAATSERYKECSKKNIEIAKRKEIS
jgi:hypothetical protein